MSNGSAALDVAFLAASGMTKVLMPDAAGVHGTSGKGLMKLPASHSSPFVSKRHKPHHITAFSSALEHLNPTALHSPRQGFHLLIEVTQLPRFHCLTDGGKVK